MSGQAICAITHEQVSPRETVRDATKVPGTLGKGPLLTLVQGVGEVLESALAR